MDVLRGTEAVIDFVDHLDCLDLPQDFFDILHSQESAPQGRKLEKESSDLPRGSDAAWYLRESPVRLCL